MSSLNSNFVRRLLTPNFARAAKSQKPNLRRKLQFVSLEDRVTPTVFSVINADDSGLGSLRQAIIDANASSGNDIIDFALAFQSSSKRIDLDAPLPPLRDDGVSITNSFGPANATVNAQGDFDVFRIHDLEPATFLSIDGITITGGFGGFAGQGSAITVPDGAQSTDLTIQNSVITGNAGGIAAIYLPYQFDGLVTIQNSTISGNTSRTGGIYFKGDGSLLVEGSTFSGNVGTGTESWHGGAISFNGIVGSGGVTIQNSTIHRNASVNTTGGGGGVNLRNVSGSVLIRNSTITANTAPFQTEGGSGIGVTGGSPTVTLASSIVAENFGNGLGPDVRGSDGPINVTNSLIGVGHPSFNNVAGNQIGTVASPLNPKLNVLGFFGGPTQVRLPKVSSPALDVGSNPGSLPTDQRGFTRSVAGTDIGAVERQVSEPVPVATGTAANVLVAGGTSHTVTVTFEDLAGTTVGIDTSTIINNNNAVKIVAPNGAILNAVYQSIDFAANGTPRVVTYTFTPPGGVWDGFDDGKYSIQIVANQVLDQDGVAVNPGEAGIFFVNMPINLSSVGVSGPGTLREALVVANRDPFDNFIQIPAIFDDPFIINAASATFFIDGMGGNLEIVGPGADVLTLDGEGLTRVLDSTAPELKLSGFRVAGGLASGSSGGGLRASGIVTLDRMAFELNEATGSTFAVSGGGGGIAMIPGSFLTVTNSTISGNTATLTGGGIQSNYGGLVVENSTISGNITSFFGTNYRFYGGGGVAFLGTPSATPPSGFVANTAIFRNSTIAGNTTTGSGGGIAGFYEGGSPGVFLIQNSTITGNNSSADGDSGSPNFVPFGGGGISVRFGGSVVVRNSVIAGNTNISGPDIRSSFSVNVGSSLIGSTTGFSLTSAGGNLAAGTDPMLGLLVDNGGPTLTRAPQPGSPLINAGNNAQIPAGLTTDQLGSVHTRIFGANVDIGAYEVQPTSVTVEKAVGQADPAMTGPILFDVVFEVPVTGFTASDVTLNSTVGGTVTISGSGDTYQISVNGMFGSGTVSVSIPANVAFDGSLTGNLASTSIDNSVQFDNTAPTVTIEKATTPLQADPTNNPTIVFDVTFNEAVSGFDASDVVTTGSTVTFSSKTVFQVDSSHYRVTFLANPGQTGDLVVAVPAGAAIDVPGNPSLAATSTDNSVHFDDVRPTVTVNQAVGQSDTAYGTSVKFDVVFNEPVVGFNGTQLAFTGSTATGTFATSVVATGATSYTVTVSGFTAGGTVIANLPANSVADTAGNLNQASTFTDKTVTLVLSGTVQFSAPTYTVDEFAGTTTTLITVTRLGGTEGQLKVDYATVIGGTATNPADYIGVSGTLTFLAGSSAAQNIVITINDDTSFEGNETVNLVLSNVTVNAMAAPGALGSQSTAVLTIDDYEEGTFSFSSPTFNAAEGGTASIVVTRTNGTDGAASVDYSLVLGSAEAADIGAPSIPAGIINFADGDISKTITIPVNSDSLSEGSETINFVLSNPQPVGGSFGAVLGGTASAVLAIDPSNPIALNASNKYTIKLTDTDLDTITAKLTGSKIGTLNVYLTDQLPTSNLGPISFLDLVGTDPLKSSLSVSVTKATKAVDPGGLANGKTTIGGVRAPGLKVFGAAKVDIDGAAGPGLNVAGYLGSVTMADVLNGADITSGAGTASQKTKFALGRVGNGTDIVAGPISTFTAIDVGTGSITAPSVSSITTKGNKKALPTAIAGDFKADVTLNGSGVAVGKPTLTTLKIAGSLNADINVTGILKTVTVGTPKGVLDTMDGTLTADSVGAITVNGNLLGDITITGNPTVVPFGKPALNTLKILGVVDAGLLVGGTVDGSNIRVGSSLAAGFVNLVQATNFRNSTFFAGYSGTTTPTAAGFFGGKVTSFKITGTTGSTDAFANSYVIANSLKNVSLQSVNSSNGAIPFGFYAHEGITKLTVGKPITFTYNFGDPDASILPDFVVKIV